LDANSNWPPEPGPDGAAAGNLPSKKMLALILLWGLFIAWCARPLLGNLAVYGGTAPLAVMMRVGPVMTVSFWGLLAGLLFAANVANLFGWGNRRRLILVCAKLPRLASTVAINSVFAANLSE